MAWDENCQLLSSFQSSELMEQILQLTSLLPTAEHFSILLRDALKSQVRPYAERTDIIASSDETVEAIPTIHVLRVPPDSSCCWSGRRGRRQGGWRG
jgi:hypothetical protein